MEVTQRLILTLFVAGVLLVVEVVNGEDSKVDYAKLSGIIIPGFASTQLRAWSILDCPYSPLDFNPLDLVWLDTTKLRQTCKSICPSVSVGKVMDIFMLKGFEAGDIIAPYDFVLVIALKHVLKDLGSEQTQLKEVYSLVEFKMISSNIC
ncbi:hypothetical protein Ancab_019715 [Ancistrocladus abbreviatus]